MGRAGDGAKSESMGFRRWFLLAVILAQTLAAFLQSYQAYKWRTIAYRWEAIAERCAGTAVVARRNRQ
jgi:hypothetical protein